MLELRDIVLVFGEDMLFDLRVIIVKVLLGFAEIQYL